MRVGVRVGEGSELCIRKRYGGVIEIGRRGIKGCQLHGVKRECRQSKSALKMEVIKSI